MSTAKYDNFLFLYSPTLNPALPLVNARIGNDDLLPGFTTSGFAYGLLAGVDYMVVTTAFGNADFGAFSNTIAGAGTVVPAAPPPPPVPVTGLVTITGDTTGSPTFNRPLEDLSGLSAIGTDVAYDSYGFTVDASGTYSFISSALFDNFTFLYSPELNTALPLLNAPAGDDDLLPGFTTSGFVFDLIAGVDYFLVTTGFGNSDFGSYSNTIGGPGNILPIAPEPPAVSQPASLALILLGFALIPLARVRR